MAAPKGTDTFFNIGDPLSHLVKAIDGIISLNLFLALGWEEAILITYLQYPDDNRQTLQEVNYMSNLKSGVALFGAIMKVRFLTKIYQPNIDKLGRVCLDILKDKWSLDILKDKWSPALQIRTVLLSIQALLSAPNPDDPLSENIAKHWKANEAEAVETAKEWTRLYASGA